MSDADGIFVDGTDAAKPAWVARVLGLTVPAKTGTATGERFDAEPAIDAAARLRDQLDAQLIAWRDAFSDSGDPRGATIVQRGVTPLAVRLHARLDLVASVLGRAADREAAGQALASLRALLETVADDPGVAYLERTAPGGGSLVAGLSAGVAELAALLGKA